MTKLEWNDALNINVSDFDDKMKMLFSQINRYLEYDGKKIKEEDHEDIAEVLADVSEAVRIHFGNEEMLLTQYRYPEFSGHKKEHRRFLKKILAFRRVFSEDPDKIYKDSAKYLREWLVRHIQDEDMRYAPFIRVQKYLNEHQAMSRRGR
jgi:hemerythrin